MRDAARSALPPSLPPRGVRRAAAAEYVGVSPSKFAEWVEEGRMPPPIRPDGPKGVALWDVRRLDIAFDALSDADAQPHNEWDVVLPTRHQ